jgi:hypothetical protein
MCQVAEALQYESARAHTKEGKGGRTSNRLAHLLFEGLDWEVGAPRCCTAFPARVFP